MNKFEISGKIDFSHLFEPRPAHCVSGNSSGSIGPKFGVMISEFSDFSMIEGDGTFGNIMNYHQREFVDIHGEHMCGISSTSSKRPVVLGVPQRVIDTCEIWNTGPDRFITGKRAKFVLSEYKVERPGLRLKYLAVIGVRLLEEVTLPTEGDFWSMISAKNATEMYSKFLKTGKVL